MTLTAHGTLTAHRAANAKLKHRAKNGITSSTILCRYKQLHSTVHTAEERQQKFHFCRLPLTACLISLISSHLDLELTNYPYIF